MSTSELPERRLVKDGDVRVTRVPAEAVRLKAQGWRELTQVEWTNNYIHEKYTGVTAPPYSDDDVIRPTEEQPTHEVEEPTHEQHQATDREEDGGEEDGSESEGDVDSDQRRVRRGRRIRS